MSSCMHHGAQLEGVTTIDIDNTIINTFIIFTRFNILHYIILLLMANCQFPYSHNYGRPME